MAEPNQSKQKKKQNTSFAKNKSISIKRLLRAKFSPKKREKQVRRQEKERNTLEKREAALSSDLYITSEEALGPTVYNDLYLKKAGAYRVCRYGILLFLALFLFGMLNFFREEITIENFRYLMRNVDFELRTELGEEGIISYDSNRLNVFAVYKNSLAQLSDRQIAIYDAGGRTSYTGSLNYTAPAICASEKYVLAYDRTGGDYSLYTSFSQNHTDTTGFPIADADITDSGVYVIASRSKEYFGVVSVYSDNFQLMNKIQKNKHIASVDLTEDGKNLLIASYYIGESGIVTELMTLAVDSDTPTLLFTVEGILPWEAAWLSDKSFVLICDQGVKFYDEGGKIYNEYGFSEKNVIEYRVSQSPARIALICREGSDTQSTRLYLLSETGQPLAERAFTTAVEQLTFAEDQLILLSGNTAWRISEDGNTEYFDSDSALQAVVADKDVFYLCTPTRAVVPSWKKLSS